MNLGLGTAAPLFPDGCPRGTDSKQTVSGISPVSGSIPHPFYPAWFWNSYLSSQNSLVSLSWSQMIFQKPQRVEGGKSKPLWKWQVETGHWACSKSLSHQSMSLQLYKQRGLIWRGRVFPWGMYGAPWEGKRLLSWSCSHQPKTWQNMTGDSLLLKSPQLNGAPYSSY